MTHVPEAGDDPVQHLTPAGELTGPPPEHDPGTLRGWYRDMVLIRRLDAEATALQRRGELGIWAPVLGQEAAQVGAARAMAPQDHAFPTYREHGVAWCRGVDPVALLGLFRGTTQGGWDPAAHGLHLYTIVVGAHALHATGYAMGVQRDGAVGTGDPARDTAVVAFFGDGATAQGDVAEAFTFASVMQAPVVFFCQNNGWAISEPNERQTRGPLHRRASGWGFPGVRVDGNDVLAVHAVTSAALARARAGEGPTLVEAVTYRMGAHTTSDDPGRYRSAAVTDDWRGRDPIARFETYLRAAGHLTEDDAAAVAADADALAERLREECVALPDPPPGAMFEHVYAEPHPDVEASRAAHAAHLATLGGDR